MAASIRIAFPEEQVALYATSADECIVVLRHGPEDKLLLLRAPTALDAHEWSDAISTCIGLSEGEDQRMAVMGTPAPQPVDVSRAARSRGQSTTPPGVLGADSGVEVGGNQSSDDELGALSDSSDEELPPAAREPVRVGLAAAAVAAEPRRRPLNSARMSQVMIDKI